MIIITIVSTRIIFLHESPELVGSSAARTFAMMTSNNMTTINIGAITGAIKPALNDSSAPSGSSPVAWVTSHSSRGINIETIASPINPRRKKPSDAKCTFKVEIMKNLIFGIRAREHSNKMKLKLYRRLLNNRTIIQLTINSIALNEETASTRIITKNITERFLNRSP